MPHIRRLGQVSITSHDIPRAIAFYRDVLELPFIWGTDNMAFFACGDVRLMLSVPENEAFNHKSSVLYFDVADIHQAYADLQRQGVVFDGDPHPIGDLGDVTVWMAFFTDPDGNTMALQSEVPNGR